MNRVNSFSLTFSPVTGIEPSVQSMTSEMIWKIVKNDVVINQEVIQAFLLLLKSSDFNPFEINWSERMSLLHRASLEGKTEIVRTILFSSQFSTEEVKDLVDHQCLIDRSTALNYACLGGHLEIVKLLITAGASIYSRDKHDNTSLHLAMKKGKTDVVSELIQICGNNQDYLNAQDALNRSTALHWASMLGIVSMVQMLIASGARIAILDKYGNTPLQEAAMCGKAEVYWMLIMAGSLLKDNDVSLVPKEKQFRFIEEGLFQLSGVFQLLEVLSVTKENEVSFIVLSRIFYSLSQIYVSLGLNHSSFYVTRLRSILKREIMVSWLNTKILKWDLELSQMKSSKWISVERVEFLLKRVKNIGIGLAQFNKSFDLLPDLSHRLSLRTVFLSFSLQINFLERQVLGIRPERSRDYGQLIRTLSVSGSSSSPMRQSATEKRGRIYVSKDWRPLKITPVPWSPLR